MIQKLAFALEIDPTDLFSKKTDPVSTMKKYQKAALKDIKGLITEIIDDKLKELEKKAKKP